MKEKHYTPIAGSWEESVIEALEVLDPQRLGVRLYDIYGMTLYIRSHKDLPTDPLYQAIVYAVLTRSRLVERAGRMKWRLRTPSPDA